MRAGTSTGTRRVQSVGTAEREADLGTVLCQGASDDASLATDSSCLAMV